jgi:hypothetical protein
MLPTGFSMRKKDQLCGTQEGGVIPLNRSMSLSRSGEEIDLYRLEHPIAPRAELDLRARDRHKVGVA